MDPVLVVGAGVAGLAAAEVIASRGRPVLVAERESVPGGLSRSFRYAGYNFDIGPHRFHVADEATETCLREYMGEDLLAVYRDNEVYFLNRYYSWPPDLRCIFHMPLTISARAFIDLILSPLMPPPRQLSPDSFEADLLIRYGRTLYEVFFRDYTEKYLGIPARQTHRDWGETGLRQVALSRPRATSSLGQLVGSLFLPCPSAAHFLYPRSGMGQFALTLAERIRKLGGTILLDTPILRLHHEDNRIIGWEHNRVLQPCSAVIWTASLTLLFRALGLPEPALHYLSLILYNLELEMPPLRSSHWIYFGDPSVIFNRVTRPGSFAPDLVPAGKGSLGVEVTCREGDDVWNHPERLEERVVADLVRVGMIPSAAAVGNIHIERIREAYPIYQLNYRELQSNAFQDLSLYKNLFPAGRTGLFWYNNMDQSIRQARELAETLVGSAVIPPT